MKELGNPPVRDPSSHDGECGFTSVQVLLRHTPHTPAEIARKRALRAALRPDELAELRRLARSHRTFADAPTRLLRLLATGAVHARQRTRT